MQWRSHQRETLALADAIAAGACPACRILAAVTPGGGKSALPVLLASRLLPAGLARRVCWVVPRDSLRLQAEEAFADARFRTALGAGPYPMRLRAAESADPEPWRGADGWATTYQALAADPAGHLARFRAAGPALLVLDEAHHLPALDTGNGAAAEGGAWSQAAAPLLAEAAFALLLTGTLERADGRRILGLPYLPTHPGRPPRVDAAAPGWAVIGYSRRRALAERAVLPVRFGALDGEASWLAAGEGGRAPLVREEGPSGSRLVALGPHRLAAPRPGPHTRPALFAALRTGFARALLLRALEETRALRAQRRAEGLASPGRLLVVAADQDAARQALRWLRGALGPRRAHLAALATSDSRAEGAEALARFRRGGEGEAPACLVTVAMAHEGMDAPAVAVLAALTQVRSAPWLEQMVARATRVDPGAGPWEAQRAAVFHPDDPLFAAFRARMEREQGEGRAGPALAARRAASANGVLAQAPPPIVPLSSRALGLRWAEWRPGPAAPAGLGAVVAADEEPPSRAEARLRRRVAALVAAQAAEDAGEGHLRTTQGRGGGEAGLLHAYNAVLKRVLGGRARAAMAAAELEEACAWLAANRLSERLGMLEGDARFAWAASRRFGAGPLSHLDFSTP